MATVTVIQTGSPIRRTKDQRATLKGLGLNRIGRKSVLEDTPSIRGMNRSSWPSREPLPQTPTPSWTLLQTLFRQRR